MAWFSRKKQAPEVLPATVPVPRLRTLDHDDDDEPAFELTGPLAQAIERSVRKSLTASQYVAWDQADDQGGYFGTEFEIRTTAGRIKGLYSREPWIYKASEKIAKTMSTVPLKVYQKGTDKELPKHPLKELIDAGSQAMSSKDLRWTRYLDLTLGGNYFLLLEKDYKTIAGLAPVELVNLKYAPDNSRVIAIEVYSAGTVGSQTATFPIEQVVHVKMPNPYNYAYGMSPFAAAARPILLDRYKNEFEMAFYLRGATSAGVVETTEDLSKSRFQRLMRTFEQAFTGRANWWRTLFLPKGAKFVKSSLTMQEMQHLEGMRENRLTILAVLGIPPSQVGIVQDVNRATSESQERLYYNETIVPLIEFEAAGWNNSYLVKTIYGGKVEVRPDFSGVEAIEGFVTIKAEKAKAMEPYFTIDEIRERVWKADPMSNGRGDRLVAEVKGGGTAPTDPGTELALLPTARKAVLPDGFTCQCLCFPKDTFQLALDCQKWAEANGYKSDGVTESANEWRIEQAPMDGFEPDTLQDLALAENVRAVIGKLRDDEAKQATFLRHKTAATASQNRIEAKLGEQLAKAVDAYIDDLLEDAVRALDKKRPVRDALKNRADERRDAYLKRALRTYELAMERGFAAATSQVKCWKRDMMGTKRATFAGLNETDQQAVDVLRERTRDGQRRVLKDRAIERFVGLDANRTDAVIGLIEEGEREGKTYEEIARGLRAKYGEAYRNQARTIVRTEVLSAVSEGLAWNHNVLQEVFSDVRKEWLHQGDDGNPDARQEHMELDGTEVGANEAWLVGGEQLRYPRDPRASAGQVVNCRCTMLSVIPDSATSNADAILESDE